jgi:TfoX/Sxy family transcriptional regulator of competence genes
MATALDFIEYVCDQINDVGEVRHKKMFGEYMIYVNDKPILLVCNNTVHVKMLSCLDGLLSDSETGIPYSGAKEHYILDPDNADLLRAVAGILEPITPLPKPRKKKRQV